MFFKMIFKIIPYYFGCTFSKLLTLFTKAPGLVVYWNSLVKPQIKEITFRLERSALTLLAPTSQNGQTHSNNPSAKVDELNESV